MTKEQFRDIWLEIRYNKITYFLTDIKDGLQNLWDYLPLIWKDRDWDHAFLDRLLIFKLKRMENHHRNHCHIIRDWERIADELMVARIALERIDKDEYPGFLKYLAVGDVDIKETQKDVRMAKADLELFCKYFLKYSRGWWC